MKPKAVLNTCNTRTNNVMRFDVEFILFIYLNISGKGRKPLTRR